MSAIQPCPSCLAEDCCGDNPFTFSLVAGQVYANDQIAIDFVCPPGFRCIPGVYLIPKGTFTLVVPSNEASTLRIQCCSSEITQQIPAGATAEEIGVIAQNMVNACALQQANCNANATVNYRNRFTSEQVTANSCANTGRLMGWISGSQPPLPSAIQFYQGTLVMKAGVFSSQTSQSNANQKAQTFLDNYAISLVFQGIWDCGYWNEATVCPLDPMTPVPAFIAFSTASQEQANQNAIAATCAAACMTELAQIAYAGIGTGGQSAPGRGAYTDKVYVAAGSGGLMQIDVATNTLDYQFILPEDARALSVRSNGLILVFGATAFYIVDPATGGSITNSFPYPGTCTLSYDSATPYNDVDDFSTVVCRGNIGPGNRDHIVSCGLGSPTVVYSSPTSFASISAPGGYDSLRNQYCYKILDSTTYPVGPERLLLFSSAFAVLNTAVVSGIRNGDGLIYCSGPDYFYYWGRENTLGHGLYPVDPVSLAFGFLILAGDSFPSGQMAYNATTDMLAIMEDSTVTFVDTITNTIPCDGVVPSSNDNAITFSSDPNKLFVKTDAGIISVRQTP